ncbi:glycoside hydrolase family 5 protein [Cucurbitaria berberidis CBS 394.84]|uniref:Glycoside hydrolase family 5 protein n=1 Tax=Cucurbitaria berberidis CBS 394.84 TaxID=1168544 RepID=A0A9P4GC18_9PLEO|nr:glycoside hydrolase family 5 protein [Cucurbitaria berberidis CBS 394.84]KAF1843103.1 glycoside hydrolase family 5 protein [Cucurbitaria berberidis CBS 394.84]
MKGFLQKAKAELRGKTQRDTIGFPGRHFGNGHSQGQYYDPPDEQFVCSDSENVQAQTIHDPTPLDILRYRYHHATNLGSIYVIERWLQPSRFPDGAEGSSELAAVKAWVDRIGIEATKQKFEEDWTNALSEDDIQWLVDEAKCTTIRLPIGYFDLPGAEFTQDTPFEPYARVYEGAWNNIRTLISRLRAHSIGVLLDLHALPGGANAQEHSGTNSGRAEFWNSSSNRDLGVRCCQFLAEDATTGSEIAGIQLVNEALWEAEGMYEWYDECIDAISDIDASIPIFISDGWNFRKAIDYTLQKNSVNVDQPTSPVVIDTHYYWAFTDDDKKKSPQQVIWEVHTKLAELDGKEGSVLDRGAVQVIVGEYSCVLTEDSWAKSGGTPKEELVEQFGEAQSKRYQQRAGGSFFWTYKMDWMPGGEWGFTAQSDAGNIVPPPYTQLSLEERGWFVEKARDEKDRRMRKAVQQHVTYWRRVDPHGSYEFEKYQHGWNVGFQDALAFFEGRATQGDKIGMLEIWVLKRVRESGYRGALTWQFEHGLRKGIQDLYAAVEI